FKESLSVLLISILFILLAANMNMSELELLVKDWRPIALFFFVALILRPISVFLSTMNGNLSINEKLFISWVGPRGIVAAGIASLFGLKLQEQGVTGAEYITPLVFMIVLGTVLINATTARLVARLLGVIQDSSSGVLIIGANNFSITIASYLREQGRTVYLVDSNVRNIAKAEAQGLGGIVANIYNTDLAESYELLDVGYLLAFTGSNEVNQYALKRYSDIFGEREAYRLITSDELKERQQVENEHIFSYTDDFINLSEAHRESPTIYEKEIRNQEEFRDLMSFLQAEKYIVPLFVKYPDGSLNAVPKNAVSQEIKESGYYLVCMGIPLPEPYAETVDAIVEET
ncbi:MAG: cation:proton antiporter, partial [Bacteroidota bacterium]